jgi:hypothetical protein
VYVTAQRENLTGDAPEFENLNSQKKDKKLLDLANDRGFKVVITIDKSMQAEQNNNTPIHVITINIGSRQTFENIQPMIPDINKKISEIEDSIKRGIKPSFITISAPTLE